MGTSCVATSACCLLPYCCAFPGRFASIFSTPSHQVVADCNQVPPKPFPLQAQLAQPLLLHYVVQPRPSWWCLPHPLQHVHTCLVLRNWTQHSRCIRTVSLDLQVVRFLMQLLAFLAARALASTRSASPPGPFLQRCFPTGQWSPRTGASGCSSRARGFAFAFVPLRDVPPASFLQPVELLWGEDHCEHTAEQEGLKWKQGGHTVNAQCGIVVSHLHIQGKASSMTGMELVTI